MKTQMSIRHKLTTSFSVVLLLTCVAIGVGAVKLRNGAGQTSAILDLPLKKERITSDWYRVIDSGSRRTLAIAVSSDPVVEEVFRDDMKLSTAMSTKFQNSLVELAKSPKEVALIDDIKKARGVYLPLRNQIAALRKEGKGDEALALANAQLKPATAGYLSTLQAMLDYQRATIDADIAELNQGASSSVMQLVGLGVLIVAIGTAFAVYVSLSVSRPIRHAMQVVKRIASGDLSQRISTQATDEVGQLLTAMDEMTLKLRGMVSSIERGAKFVDAASSEIASGNDNLSQRTEKRSAALQQSASSIEQLSGAVRANADNASEAKELASRATVIARDSSSVMAEVVITMGEISSSSQRIAEIIGVIDGIAFQTNILALNAAVEAARAGEHGRGFSVVASEVRALAQRSAKSAHEIRGLIGSSASRVGDGERLVQTINTRTSELTTSIGHVARLVDRISAASAEQASGISLVNQSVAAIESSMQQDAALVEESAAAAASLREQAANLNSTVAEFRT